MDDLQKKTCIAIVNVFESGSAKGNYAAVTVVKGDAGHLTYGRSQTTLPSGNLYLLLKAYVDAPDAQYATEINPYLDRVAAKDLTLDFDMPFRAILKEAGQDPAMQREQDDFFDRAYYVPSMAAAKSAGLQLPLSQTVVYDSHIQGGWLRIYNRVLKAIGPVSSTSPEQQWVAKFVETRKDYLNSCKPPLPASTYRMDSFNDLMQGNNWDLGLPLTVHGVQITDATFGAEAAAPIVRASVPEPDTDARAILRPTVPYTRGADVLKLQQLLNAAGLKNSEDQIYGPFTQALVEQFQLKSGLKADAVVGPQTWTSLLGNTGTPA